MLSYLLLKFLFNLYFYCIWKAGYNYVKGLTAETIQHPARILAIKIAETF